MVSGKLRNSILTGLLMASMMFGAFLFMFFSGNGNITGFAVFGGSEDFEKGGEEGAWNDFTDLPDLWNEFVDFFDQSESEEDDSEEGLNLAGNFPNSNSSSGGASPIFRKGGGSGGGNSGGGIIRLWPLEWAPFYRNFVGGFNPRWEDFSDISNVCDGQAVLEIPGVGRIRWRGCVDALGANFSRDVGIGMNRISVDSYLLHSSFNSTAEVVMEGLDYDYIPAIYRNGEYCSAPQCTVLSYENGELTFEVLSFSSYTTGPNTRLEVWDETDLGEPYAGQFRYPGEDTYFYANYANITSGGGGCRS